MVARVHGAEGEEKDLTFRSTGRLRKRKLQILEDLEDSVGCVCD